MRNILDELYDFDLFHLSEVGDTDEAYRAALDRLIKCLTKDCKDCCGRGD